MIASVVACAHVSAQEYATSWDHEIQVEDGLEKFGTEDLHAYSITAFEVSEGDLRKLLLDEVKTHTSEKATRKKIKQGIKVTLPGFDGDDLAVKVKSDDIAGEGNVKVSVAFLNGSDVVNPTDYPAGHEAAREVMHDLGVQLNRAVVTVQVNNATAELEDLQKKQESLDKKNYQLQKAVLDGKDDLLDLKTDYAKLQEKSVKASSESASLEVMAKGSAATEKDMKKYSKARSKSTKIESRLLKINQKQAKTEGTVREAEMELPLLSKQIEDNNSLIEIQKELVNQLELKLDQIR